VEVVSLDVALHPVLGGAGAAGKVGEQFVGDGDHGLDAAAGERGHAEELGVKELPSLVDAVVLEQPQHHLGRHRVPRLRVTPSASARGTTAQHATRSAAASLANAIVQHGPGSSCGAEQCQARRGKNRSGPDRPGTRRTQGFRLRI
jgi:hypothetical protein